MSNPLRHLSAIALVAVATLVLSACVMIPASGPVLTGREVSEQEFSRTEIVPEGPAAGADQEAILRGFISAHSGSGSSGNYDVARQFLSATFAEEWDPRESVLIRSGANRFERVAEDAIEYSTTIAATVDADGAYTAFAPAPQSLTYEFVQEEGEWRIAGGPDGIVVLSETFDDLFSDHALYFLDPARQALVPDLRWFPRGTAATRVASALLAGPPSWLAGAVGTAFPDGTQLTSPRRVPVEDQVAVVDLTAEALAANPEQRQLMRLQLEASFGELPSVSSVEVLVEGTPMSILPMGQNAPQVRPQVDSRMLVLRDGEFGYLANNQITQIDGLSAKVAATNPTDVTLGFSGTLAATLSADGVYLVRAAADQPALVDARPGLIAPALDGYGYLWTAQRSDPGSIRATDLEGNQFAVATPLPSGAEIVSLAVSRDGARIAILLGTNAGPRLMVAAVIRDQNSDQVPVSLGEPRLDVIVNTGEAIDATWADELSVATLTSVGGVYAVNSYQVGGKSKDLGNPGRGVSIVGGNSESGLRVLGEDGVVQIRRGSGWQSGPKATLIATQR